MFVNNNKIEPLDNHDVCVPTVASSYEIETGNGEISVLEPRSNSSSEVEECFVPHVRAPRPSEFVRKYNVSLNHPPCGKRRSQCRSINVPLSVKPEQRVKVHPQEPFSVSNNTLSCQGCYENLCIKSSSVENHL